MHIFRFIVLFWVSTRIGLHALMLRKHASFLCFLCPVLQRCVPPPFKLPSL